MALDSNGIWQYEESDPASPFSDLLNLLAASVSGRVEDLGDLIAALNLAVDGSGADITEFGPGWKATDNKAHRPVVRAIGEQMFLYGAVTKDTALGAGSAGNILNIPTAYAPTTADTRFIGTTVTSAGQYGALALANGRLNVPVGYGNINVANNGVVPIVGQWWRS